MSYSLGIADVPIGSLLGGYLATFMNSSIVFTFAGIGISFIAIIWILHRNLRGLPKANQMSAATFKIQLKQEDL